jgi:crotonobetainyl-CoA:carnitine CoA-transferase CaiB-like acyl-CoA transferase
LADQGADVIKIEEPDVGDYARYMEPYIDGTGSIFSTVNRGKRSISLDLSDEPGQEVLRRLASNADVVVEGFRPGVMESLNVSYDDLSALNEDLIYCSISGYGQDGPFADRAGHDLNYEGYAGFLDMTRSRLDRAPAIPGVPVADLAAGLQAGYQIVGALLGRELGNDYERYLDVSMAESALSLTQVVLAAALAGEDPRPGETLLTGKYPCYGIYPTRDDKYVTLSALEPKFWSNFCEAVERPDLEELHLSEEASQRTKLRGELETLFRTKSRDEWEDKLGDEDVMVGAVLEPSEVVETDHFLERDTINTEEYRVNLVGGSDSEKRDWPEKGEHTEEVLSESGYSSEELNRLRDEGIV